MNLGRWTWAALAVGVACGSPAKDSAPGGGSAVGTTTGTVGATPTGGLTDGPCAFSVTSWVDGGAAPSDGDGDGVNDTGCDEDVLEICITDPLGTTEWWLGMAEDGPQGWTGEDCFAGAAGAALCHPVGIEHTLTEVCTPDEVVAGQSTLLDASKDPYLTYYLEDGAGACFVWGTNPAYYATLGCTEMM